MKKLLYLLFVMVSIVCANSCSSDDEASDDFVYSYWVTSENTPDGKHALFSVHFKQSNVCTITRYYKAYGSWIDSKFDYKYLKKGNNITIRWQNLETDYATGTISGNDMNLEIFHDNGEAEKIQVHRRTL